MDFFESFLYEKKRANIKTDFLYLKVQGDDSLSEFMDITIKFHKAKHWNEMLTQHRGTLGISSVSKIIFNILHFLLRLNSLGIILCDLSLSKMLKMGSKPSMWLFTDLRFSYFVHDSQGRHRFALKQKPQYLTHGIQYGELFDPVDFQKKQFHAVVCEIINFSIHSMEIAEILKILTKQRLTHTQTNTLSSFVRKHLAQFEGFFELSCFLNI